MRSVLLAMFLSVGMTLGAAAQSGDIQNTISRQLQAFEVDDFASAFQFASPNLRSYFGSPENFGQMVTRGYPMVWRPGEVRFLDLREIGGSLWQKVMITDQSGRVHLLDYQMLQTPEGWRISGVQLLSSADPSV